jgi:hypothetical protein
MRNNFNKNYPHIRFFDGYKKINKGFIRLNFLFSILFVFYIIITQYYKHIENFESGGYIYHNYYNNKYLLYDIINPIIIFIGYWILVRIGIWIIDGFKEEKNKNI